MNENVEFFASVRNRNKHQSVKIGQIVKYIKTNANNKRITNDYRNFLANNPSKKEKSERKVNDFPAVLFSGCFSGTGKANEIRSMSGLISIDIDHVSDLQTLRERLINDPYTYLLFVSPSNEGIKIVIKHTLTQPENWQSLFRQLEVYYLENYNIQIDEACKDISRACFLPYDDQIFVNSMSLVWDYISDFNKVTKTVNQVNNDSILFDSEEIKHELYYRAAFLAAHRIDITTDYQDWISIAYSLAYYEEQGRLLFHMVSSVNRKYDYQEANELFSYCLQHFDKDRITADFFQRFAKQAIANYSIYKYQVEKRNNIN